MARKRRENEGDPRWGEEATEAEPTSVRMKSFEFVSSASHERPVESIEKDDREGFASQGGLNSKQRLRLEAWAKEQLTGLTPEQCLRVAAWAVSQVQHLPAFPGEQPEENNNPDKIRAAMAAAVGLAWRIGAGGTFGGSTEPPHEVQKAQQTLNSFSREYAPLLDAAAALMWATRSFCEGKNNLVIINSEKAAVYCVEAAASAGTEEVARFVRGAIEFRVNRIRDEGREGRTSPKQADDPLNLEAEVLPQRPDEALADLLSHFEHFARAHPDRAKKAAEQCAEMAEKLRAPSTERTLGLTAAARRIGISNAQLLRLYQQDRLGDEMEGRPKFSEAECDAYRDSPRKRGRPKKIDPAS